jgi:hypothetical protein
MAAADFVKALTLLDYTQRLEQDSMERAFMETYVRESDVLAAIPIIPVNGGKFTGWNEAELPDVKNRAFNEDGNTSKGRIEKQEEGVFLMDEYIKVDRAMVDLNGEGERARQEAMKIKAMSRHGTRVIMKGDNASEPREADGLQRRSARADQTIVVNNAASGGGPLSLSKLDAAINEVRNPTHLIQDRSMKPLWEAAARSPTLTNTRVTNDTDDLGRRVLRYGELPILFGYPKSRGDSVLPFSEVGSGGGAAVTSSIYVVSFSADEGVFLLEGTPLAVRDEGQLPGVPLLSTHVKWDWGMYSREYAIARLSSINNGAIVV